MSARKVVPPAALREVETFALRARLRLLQATDAERPLDDELLARTDVLLQDLLLRSIFARFARVHGLAEWAAPEHVQAAAALDEAASPPRSALRAFEDELLKLPLSALAPADLGVLHELNLARFPVRDPARGITLRARAGGRRSRGAYYTPRVVARDILRRTLGVRLFDERGAVRRGQARTAEGAPPGEAPDERARPEDVAGLRLLDPACGAGLFLSEAFDMLLAFYRGWGMHEEGVRRTLGRHLQGFDLDAGAISAARSILSLQAAAACRCGAADGVLPGSLRVTDSLALAPTVAAGSPARGFDFVVGNPPYISNREIPSAIKEALASSYRVLAPGYDLSVPFIEAGLHLLRPGGRLAYLITNKFLAAEYGMPVRRLILEEHSLLEVEDLSRLPLFRGAASYPVVVVVEKAEPRATVRLGESGRMEDVPLAHLRQLPGRIITTRLRPGASEVLRRIFTAGVPLPDAIIRCGIARSGFARRAIDEAALEALPSGERARYRRLLVSADVWPFRLGDAGRRGNAGLSRGPRRFIHESVAGPSLARLMAGRKLLVAGAGLRLRAAVDLEGAALGRVYFVREAEAGEDLDYLAALLNSRLLNWLYALLFWPAHMAGGYLRVNAPYLARLPLARRALLSGSEREAAEELTSLARGWGAEGREKDAEAPADASRAAGAAGARDLRWGELDRLVERIYGLGEAERAFVADDLSRWSAAGEPAL